MRSYIPKAKPIGKASDDLLDEVLSILDARIYMKGKLLGCTRFDTFAADHGIVAKLRNDMAMAITNKIIQIYLN